MKQVLTIVFLLITLFFLSCENTVKSSCEAGSLRCNSSIIQKCKDGEWVDWTDCSVDDLECQLIDGEASCVDPEGNTVDDSDVGNTGNTGDTGNSGWSSDEYVVDCTEAECTVPAGSFWMGCNESIDSLCASKEYPYHEVTLSAYKIDKYEVTVAQYQACVSDGACNNNSSELHYKTTEDNSSCNLGASEKDDHPMNCVTWYGAKAYCEWLGKRLPTEAEWEKAARGTDGRVYLWGNETATCEYAVMSDSDAGGDGCGTGGTMAVGSKKTGISPYGAYDMSGNVWEWCSDWYDIDYYKISPSENPTGPESGSVRVLRGGSWENQYKDVRTSTRGSRAPVAVYTRYGFRCVDDDSGDSGNTGDTGNSGDTGDSGDFVFEEDYESYSVDTLPSDYIIVYNGSGDSAQKIVEEDDNKFLQTKGRSGWGLAMRKDFDTDFSENIVVEWKIQTRTTANSTDYDDDGFAGVGSFSIKNGAEIAAIVQMGNKSDENMYVYRGSYSKQVERNVWISCKMVIDFANEKYDIYVNDELVVEDYPTIVADLNSTWNSFGEDACFRFGSGNSSATTTLFDDIVIYEK